MNAKFKLQFKSSNECWCICENPWKCKHNEMNNKSSEPMAIKYTSPERIPKVNSAKYPVIVYWFHGKLSIKVTLSSSTHCYIGWKQLFFSSIDLRTQIWMDETLDSHQNVHELKKLTEVIPVPIIFMKYGKITYLKYIDQIHSLVLCACNTNSNPFSNSSKWEFISKQNSINSIMNALYSGNRSQFITYQNIIWKRAIAYVRHRF